MTEEDYLEDEIFNNSGVNFQVGEDEREKIVFLQDKYPEEFGVMIKELTTFVKQYGDQRELQGRLEEQKKTLTIDVETLVVDKKYANGFNDAIKAVEVAKDKRVSELEAKLKAKESE